MESDAQRLERQLIRRAGMQGYSLLRTGEDGLWMIKEEDQIGTVPGDVGSGAEWPGLTASEVALWLDDGSVAPGVRSAYTRWRLSADPELTASARTTISDLDRGRQITQVKTKEGPVKLYQGCLEWTGETSGIVDLRETAVLALFDPMGQIWVSEWRQFMNGLSGWFCIVALDGQVATLELGRRKKHEALRMATTINATSRAVLRPGRAQVIGRASVIRPGQRD